MCLLVLAHIYTRTHAHTLTHTHTHTRLQVSKVFSSEPVSLHSTPKWNKAVRDEAKEAREDRNPQVDHRRWGGQPLQPSHTMQCFTGISRLREDRWQGKEQGASAARRHHYQPPLCCSVYISKAATRHLSIYWFLAPSLMELLVFSC